MKRLELCNRDTMASSACKRAQRSMVGFSSFIYSNDVRRDIEPKTGPNKDSFLFFSAVGDRLRMSYG